MGFLLKIPKDKLLHFIAGLIVYVVFHFINPISGLVAAIVVGIGKELYDTLHKDKHTPDLNDVIATIFGACIGFICGI